MSAPRGWRPSEAIVLAGVAVLIVAAGLVGADLNRRGVDILLPFPPLVATWDPHWGWGTPLVLGCVVLGVLLQRRVATLPWRRLLLAGWLLNLAWMVSLTLIDGFYEGWVWVLLNPNEYLKDLPRISDPVSFLRTFTGFIAFGPGVGGDQVWTTHVAGHPPLITLFFWALQQVGLGGGFWAGAACILIGSAAAVALPVLLAELGAPAAARRAVPFLALFPGAVSMAVSADGLMAGVACAGVALAARGAVRGRWLSSLLGGLLLGALVFLSYGLVLFGVVAVVAWVISARRRGARAVLPYWSITVGGALAVFVVHLALGFNWFAGLAALHTRYYQGIASTRPFSYFVWANLAAWLVSCSPLLAIGLTRAVATVWPRRRSPVAGSPEITVAAVALSGLVTALLADASALSKAETERIWLPFGVVAATGLALLRGRWATIALVGAASWAIAVNHLLDTGW